MSSALHPFRLDLGGHGQLAGVATGTGPGVVLLHDLGDDLDAVAWLSGLPGLTGMSCLALDLPGHGLSDDDGAGSSEAAIAAALAHFGREGSGPFTVVGFGHSCSLALSLAPCPEVAGVAAIAPPAGAPPLRPAVRRVPVLGVISGIEPAAEAAWRAFRTAAALPWTAIRLPVSTDGLLRPTEPTARSIASHLGGFAMDMLASRFRAPSGRSAPISGGPDSG